jgi:Uma2 family endonuclease
MATSSLFTFTPEAEYPDSDGKPMAENTLQFEWIVTLQGNLAAWFDSEPMVFVAGDLLWYPVQGDPKTRTAPDALVAFGRPKGYRGSYKQWQEGGVAPQVVWEVLSPGNRSGEMKAKFKFYERFGVEEYYTYDPDNFVLNGYRRGVAGLDEIPTMAGWTSPRLGVRFDLSEGDLTLFGPDDRPFITFTELARQFDEVAHERDELTRQRDEVARREEQARERAERLAAQLRALGLEPES